MIWIEKVLDTWVPTESLTRTVNVYVPRLVGVPEIVPDGLKVSPLGSFPEMRLQV